MRYFLGSTCVAVIGLFGFLGLIPVENPKHTHQPYAGFEARGIKSLSATDIQQIERGAGWGLALAAELNGRPGPVHLLEMKKELALSQQQIQDITQLYTAMKTDAIAAGERFIAAEKALDDALSETFISADDLDALVLEAGQARAALRLVHLATHLETPDLLTADQIQQYQVLRGYNGDPCATVPDGHIAALWRLHNGCG